MRWKQIVLLVLITLFTTSVAAAEETTNKISFSVGKLDGKTLYTISGSDSGGWKSKLVFPLETKFTTIYYSTKFEKVQWGVQRINCSIGQNLDNKNNGLMKDSDWIYAWSSDKVIYSETKADLEALQGKLEFVGPSYYYNQQLSYQFQSGYQYKNFAYNVHDGIQYNYDSGTQTEITGKALEYDVRYHIPYLGVKFKNHNHKTVNWQVNLDLAPYVKAKDIDDHILRYKESIGETTGAAIMVTSSLSYNIKSNVIFSLSGAYSKIETTGYQDQYWYDGPDQGQEINNIAHTIDLESYTIKTTINYLF